MLCEDIEKGIDISVNSTDSNESVPDQNLERAYQNSLQEGSSLPLLKEELRLKIQHRRLKSGQDELVVAESPPKPDLLTLPEVLKKNRRRYQNRRSADRSRHRWKQHEQELLETIALQEQRKSDLERIKCRLMETKKMLTDVLSQHSKCSGSVDRNSTCSGSVDRNAKCSGSVDRNSKSQKFISLLNSEWHRKELPS